MAKRTKKLKVKAEHCLKWYAIFGFCAFLIAAGVFWMFNIIYQDRISRADMISAKISAAFDYNSSNAYAIFENEPQFPVLAYAAIALLIVGAVGFLVAKVFYEKSKE